MVLYEAYNNVGTSLIGPSVICDRFLGFHRTSQIIKISFEMWVYFQLQVFKEDIRSILLGPSVELLSNNLQRTVVPVKYTN